MNGAIGDVHSVHFEWLLNTEHGADYFRRWHRDKRNSGGLLVHKSTHHFDLVNFWLGSRPQTVYAQGSLMFYGKENAEKRGVTEFYSRARGSEIAKTTRLRSTWRKVRSSKDYMRTRSMKTATTGTKACLATASASKIRWASWSATKTKRS